MHEQRISLVCFRLLVNIIDYWNILCKIQENIIMGGHVVYGVLLGMAMQALLVSAGVKNCSFTRIKMVYSSGIKFSGIK